MLVPTMGALHDGHLALVRAAKRVPGAVVVVSIFVNPLQFGAGEDLDAYPRTLDDDLALLRGEGVEIVFAPTAAAMYPDGLRTTVQPGPLAAELEGGSRPTHFAGVLTVVLQAAADRAARPGVLRREGLPAAGADPADGRRPEHRRRRSSGCRPCGKSDGLAMSSRNRYLDPAQRELAGDAVGGAAGRRACRARRCAGRAGRGARGARRGARARRSTTWSCATPSSARRPPTGRPGCWLRPGWAPPGCWTTSRSQIGTPAGTAGPDGRHEYAQSPWRN